MKKHQTLSEAGRSGRKETRLRLSTALLAAALLLGCLSGCAGMSFPTPSFGIQPTASEATEAPAETQELTEAATEAPTEKPTEAETEAETEKPTEAAEPEVEIVPEGTLSEEAQVAALLEDGRNANATEIEFTCTKTLYGDLSEDNFALMEVLLAKSGASATIYYSSRAGIIDLRKLTYPGIPWLECSSDTAVKDAIIRFGEEKQEAFKLICPKELASALNSGSKLTNFAAQGGYKKVRWSVDGSVLYAHNVEFFDEPYAVVSDAAQFSEAIAAFAEQKLTSFYIVQEENFRSQLANDTLASQIMVAGSMLEDYGKSGSSSSGVYKYSRVEYTSDPKMICYSEDDVVAAIRQMGTIGAASFRLYLVGDLIDKLCDNSFSRLHTLEAKAGMSSSRMAYSFSDTLRMLKYSEAEIVANAVALKTKKEAISFVDEKVQSGAKEMTLFCDKSLYEDLIGDLDNRFYFFNNGMTPIYDLITQAGIYDLDLSASRTTYAITIRIKSLYPGKEIILAVNSGRESSLSSRLRQTLNEARSIASSCKTSDPETTAKNIHDAICARVTYETKNEKSDNDTAVGVLLNGKADCDGYSDAFYLVCTLAGLNVRLQHGDGGGSGFDFLNSATHMWNLLELDGTWRLVDLTWDDSSDEIQHTWFNLGNDRASRGHSWNKDMTVSLADKTDLTKRPENEYSILSSSDLDSAVKQAISKKQSVFYLIFDKATYGDEKTAINALRKQSSASCTYTWNDEMRMLTVWMK